MLDILRDFKRHTAKHLLQSIHDQQESRKEWILAILEEAGSKNQKNKKYQVWRQDNHPIELNTKEVIDLKLDYLPAVQSYYGRRAYIIILKKKGEGMLKILKNTYIAVQVNMSVHFVR